MNKQILGILLCFTVLLSITQYAEAKIPPTSAIQMINGTGGNVTAGNYKDFVTFEEGTGIAISWDYTLHKITFSSNGAGNPIENYCTGTEKFRAYNSTTHLFLCDTDSTGSGGSGQNNTASSSGVGYSLVLPKVGIDLPFKGLWVSGDLSISNNATDITISHLATAFNDTDTNTAQITSAGGTTLFKQRDNATQNTIKGLTTTYGITLTGNTNDVNITPNFKVNTKTPATRQFLTSFNNATTSGLFSSVTFGIDSITCGANQFVNLITNSSGLTTCATPTGSTDTNTAQIISAGGTTLFKQRDNATQNTIKGLTTTYGITLTGNTNDVNITPNFKVNTKTPATRQFLTSFNNATTSGNFATSTFGANSITCSGTDKLSIYNNATGLFTCSTDTSGSGTARESLVATWNTDKTWANIGVTFVNVYTTGTGDPFRIDTNGKTTVTLMIDWTKVGAGTQKCKLAIVGTEGTILIMHTNLVSGINTNATVSIPVAQQNTISNYKLMCLSSTSTDDPVFLMGRVLLR